jgi:hypothetical protein
LVVAIARGPFVARIAPTVVPGFVRSSRRNLPAAGVALLAVIVAGCGGSSPRTVSGEGFAFSAPGGWRVHKTPHLVTAAPSRGDELLWVSVSPLRRPYRPALWPRVVRELDTVASGLAEQLDEGKVTSRGTVKLAGLPGRRYELSYLGRSGTLVERIVFLIEHRHEYQLLCRFAAASASTGRTVCGQFESSFALR